MVVPGGRELGSQTYLQYVGMLAGLPERHCRMQGTSQAWACGVL